MTIARILRLADGARTETDFGNGRPIPAVATRRGEWTDFAASPGVDQSLEPWGALERNGRLRGTARLTIERDEWRVRSELRSATARSVAQVRKSFREVSHILAGDHEKRQPESAVDDTVWSAWAAGIAAAGWKMSARADRRFVVDLDLRAGFWQATGEPCGPRLRLSVPIGKARLSVPECRLAVGRYLLAATDAVRLVRATHAPSRGLNLEATLPAGSTRSDSDDALNALGLAAQHVGREVDALSDAGFARKYLDLTLTKERQCEWMIAREFSCSK